MDDPRQMQVTIRVSIYQPYGGNGGLNTESQFNIPQTDFMKLCTILAKFEDLAQKVKKEFGAS